MACTAAAGGGMGAALVRSQQNIEIVLQGVHAIEAQLLQFSLVEAKQLLAAEIRGKNRL